MGACLATVLEQAACPAFEDVPRPAAGLLYEVPGSSQGRGKHDSGACKGPAAKICIPVLQVG